MKKIKLFGVAGSGKTTACLTMIKCLLGIEDKPISEEIKNPFSEDFGQYEFNDICFCSYTTAAIRSILGKIKYSTQIEIPKEHYFRTLHSITWRLCGYDGSNKISSEDKQAFFKKVGIKIEKESEDEDSEADTVVAIYDKLINFYSKRLDKISNMEIKEFIFNQYMKKDTVNIEKEHLIFVLRKYDVWKIENDKKDYVDSLIDLYERRIDNPCSVLIVDEAQDLGRLQANIIKMWTEEYHKDIFVLSGDDDQTVHEWAGATPDFLIEYECDNKLILEKSYRLPQKISVLCNGILQTINYREKKIIFSEKQLGKIKYFPDFNFHKLLLFISRNKLFEEKNYFLFRANKIVHSFSEFLFEYSNIPFGILGKQSPWNLKFIDVSNALNKITQKRDLLKREVKHLFDCLPSSTCLAYGVKSKININNKEIYTWEEVLAMTKLWNFQATLFEFKTIDSSKIPIKPKILKYLNYVKIKNNDIKSIKKNEGYIKKLQGVNYIIDVDLDDKNKLVGFNNMLGTFHSAKGLEAKNVFVFLGTLDYFKNMTDSERRCFYVACSRPFENLFFVGTMFDEGQKPYLENEFKNLILKHAEI